MRRHVIIWVGLLMAGHAAYGQGESANVPTADETRAGLLQAVSAFHALSVQGGHANAYSPDLNTRYDGSHGKYGPISAPDQIEMEPPATPWIGRTMLGAYRVTGDERYLRMASEVADALAKVQAESGGWPARARLSGPRPKTSDMDDNRTQACVLFLVELAEVEPAPGHRDVMLPGLDLLLKAQYPSGGWPQVYPPPEDQDNYRRYHTINDATIPDYMRTLLTAYRVLGEQRYLDAVLRAADWLLQVQLPEPQAVWAQQYYDDFVNGPLTPNSPAPARWFEPTALVSSESTAVLRILTEIWLETGDRRYRDAIPKAVKWFKRSRLPDGRWARFYELCTNRPLYCTPNRIITYSDEDLRPGYAWQGSWGGSAIALWTKIRKLGRKGMLAERDRKPSAERVRELGAAARQALDTLDERGLWVTEGFEGHERVWAGAFCSRVGELCAYLEALKARESG